MDRIESARIGMALLLLAAVFAAVVIVGSNEIATHNPIFDRIAAEEAHEENVAKMKPVSDCGFDFGAYNLLTPFAGMAE